MRVAAVWWVGVVVLGAAAGCTAGPSATGAPGATRTAIPGCVDANGQRQAASGDIRAGPFDASRGHWTGPAGTTLWVGSTKDAALPTGAVIRATRTDGRGEPVTVRRGADERATVATLPVYYPGLIRLPAAGQWRLDVTIGPDRGCFVVDA